MIKTESFVSDNLYTISEKINKFLAKKENIKLIDIKLSSSASVHGSQMYITHDDKVMALVIYKEGGKEL